MIEGRADAGIDSMREEMINDLAEGRVVLPKLLKFQHAKHTNSCALVVCSAGAGVQGHS